MTKCYVQKKDVFDISKLTVVGSPTITSDGVASGLNVDNYIVPFSDITLGDDFEMYLPFKLTSIMSVRQLFYRGQNDSRFAFLLGADSKAIKFNFRSSTMTLSSELVIIPDVELNIDYIVKLKLKNGLLSYGYFKNNTYIHIGELETTLVMDNINWFRLGGATNTSAIINMPEFKIYINGQLAYSPTKPIYLLERRKEGFDLSKFTVVGSPTITDDGVASGFSRGNYIDGFNYLALKDKSWTIEGSFVINESLTQNQVQLKFTGYPSQAGIIARNNGTFSFSGTIYDNSNQGSKITFSNINWEVGSIYKWVLSFDVLVGKYSLRLYNNNTLINSGEYVSTYANSQLYVITSATGTDLLAIGQGAAENEDSISCSIDLKQFSITVDDKEVFTGAKEKFYAMRGGK